MARSRIINPSFFADPDVADCSLPARLLFIALWTLADREGRLEDKPKIIRFAAFPYHVDTDVDALLAELADESRRFVIRYQGSDGRRYLQIRSFARYQRPHFRELPSQIPAPPGWVEIPDPTRLVTCETTGLDPGSNPVGSRLDPGSNPDPTGLDPGCLRSKQSTTPRKQREIEMTRSVGRSRLCPGAIQVVPGLLDPDPDPDPDPDRIPPKPPQVGGLPLWVAEADPGAWKAWLAMWERVKHLRAKHLRYSPGWTCDLMPSFLTLARFVRKWNAIDSNPMTVTEAIARVEQDIGVRLEKAPHATLQSWPTFRKYLAAGPWVHPQVRAVPKTAKVLRIDQPVEPPPPAPPPPAKETGPGALETKPEEVFAPEPPPAPSFGERMRLDWERDNPDKPWPGLRGMLRTLANEPTDDKEPA